MARLPPAVTGGAATASWHLGPQECLPALRGGFLHLEFLGLDRAPRSLSPQKPSTPAPLAYELPTLYRTEDHFAVDAGDTAAPQAPGHPRRL